jgi:hypothetical protein
LPLKTIVDRVHFGDAGVGSDAPHARRQNGTTDMSLYTVLAVVAGLACLEWALRLRERRRKPAPKSPTAPDWSSFTDHTALADAAHEARWLAPDAFLQGPFRRFLEMSSVPDDPPRVRARIMEFCRGAFLAYRESWRERGVDPVELHARARAMAAGWFGQLDAEDRDYMLEVFDGFSDHNRRGTPGVPLSERSGDPVPYPLDVR